MNPLTEKTKGGYVGYDVISALQKCIRRGEEELAFFWAIELLESGTMHNHFFKRMTVIAHEDIGIADKSAVMFAIKCIETAKDMFEIKSVKSHGSRSWELPVINAIVTLCRAEKTRLADHMKTVIFGWRSIEGWHPQIPDYAYDKHTMKGKHELHRGVDHFVDESSKLMYKIPVDEDNYKEEARSAWKHCEETGLDLKSYPDPKNFTNSKPTASPKKKIRKLRIKRKG